MISTMALEYVRRLGHFVKAKKVSGKCVCLEPLPDEISGIPLISGSL